MNLTYKILWFFLKNLDAFTFSFILIFMFDSGIGWEYWIAVLIFATANRLSKTFENVEAVHKSMNDKY